MRCKYKYLVSAVVKGYYQEKEIIACSKKQAIYFFRLYYGFRCYDIKALELDNTGDVINVPVQLKFDI